MLALGLRLTVEVVDSLTGVGTGAEQPVLRQEDWVVDAAFSPDGRLLAVLGESGTTRLWDLRTGQLCAAEQTGVGFRVLFSPTGSQIAIVNVQQDTLSVWGLGTSLGALALRG